MTNLDKYTPVIPKSELIHGFYYEGRCRNARIARWHGERKVFLHWRVKFGYRFIEAISCPEDESHYDVFVAERVMSPREIRDQDYIPLDPL